MNYYRKTVNNTANDVKLKMQMAGFTLKLSENKINDLLEVDKSIKKDVNDNLNLINSNKNIIEGKVSKLDQNLILFNRNLTNFIDSNKNVIDKIANIENNITKNHLVTQVDKEKTEFNLKLIDNHTNNIKSLNSNLNDIKSNITDISNQIENINFNVQKNYTISQINKKKIDNKSDIIDLHNTELNKTNTILSNIDNYYNLKDMIIIDILKTNIPEEININNPKSVIIKSNLNNYFKKDSFLEFKSSILILLIDII